MQVKGLEMPMHDPRAFHSVGLGYATSNRGACHLQALSHGPEGRMPRPDFGYPEPLDRFADAGKGKMVAQMQNLMCLMDSLKLWQVHPVRTGEHPDPRRLAKCRDRLGDDLRRVPPGG